MQLVCEISNWFPRKMKTNFCFQEAFECNDCGWAFLTINTYLEMRFCGKVVTISYLTLWRKLFKQPQTGEIKFHSDQRSSWSERNQTESLPFSNNSTSHKQNFLNFYSFVFVVLHFNPRRNMMVFMQEVHQKCCKQLLLLFAHNQPCDADVTIR